MADPTLHFTSAAHKQGSTTYAHELFIRCLRLTVCVRVAVEALAWRSAAEV